MSRLIPDRWLNYQPIGQQIKGTQFIAFKVPLSPEINQSVDDVDKRFDITQLLEKVPNLGMVIDLTNTQRYYGSNAFDDTGVKYVKLCIPGQTLPTNVQTIRFTNYVNEFSEKESNKDKLIGVHCTHGVNRTGYLICHHMVSSLKVQPEEAMKVFEEARGHRLERQNYRDALTGLLNIQKDDYRETDLSWRMSPRGPYNNSYRAPWKRERNEDYRFSERPDRSDYRSAHYSRPQGHRDNSHNQHPRRISERSFPLATSSRRDPLPSNDYSSRYSVLEDVYADIDSSSRSRYSWRRP